MSEEDDEGIHLPRASVNVVGRMSCAHCKQYIDCLLCKSVKFSPNLPLGTLPLNCAQGSIPRPPLLPSDNSLTGFARGRRNVAIIEVKKNRVRSYCMVELHIH